MLTISKNSVGNAIHFCILNPCFPRPFMNPRSFREPICVILEVDSLEQHTILQIDLYTFYILLSLSEILKNML